MEFVLQTPRFGSEEDFEEIFINFPSYGVIILASQLRKEPIGLRLNDVGHMVDPDNLPFSQFSPCNQSQEDPGLLPSFLLLQFFVPFSCLHEIFCCPFHCKLYFKKTSLPSEVNLENEISWKIINYDFTHNYRDEKF